MALDPYSMCPCGSGRKLKFCCHDLMSEMDKIQRMIEGEQRAACVEFIKGLLIKQPDRASLLGLKALLETQLEQFDAARATLDHFLAKHPQNVIALTQQALLLAATEGGRSAVPALQTALERVGQEIPEQTYEAIGAVGQGLLVEGHLLAAFAHLSLQMQLAEERDPRPATLLMRMMSSPRVPLLLKDSWTLAPAPSEASWSAEFNAALQLGAEGRWREAAARFEALVEPSQNAAVVQRNLGLVRSWIVEMPGSVAALRQAARLETSLDNAVELEALAQLLDTTEPAATIDVVRTVYPIADFETLLAAINGDGRAARVPVETYVDRDETNGPRPRAAFAILNRPQLASGVPDFALDEIPTIVGYAYLFGRETDREPRVELFAQGADDIAAARGGLTAIGGAALGAAEPEQILGQASQLSHLLSWNWRLPDDTPREKRQALIAQQRRNVILERWPLMPQTTLQGKSLQEAVTESALRGPCLAVILNLELSLQAPREEVDFNELRTKLQLPIAGLIDPTTLDAPENLPMVRIGRVEAAKAPTALLVDYFQRVEWVHFATATWDLGAELLRRTDLPAEFDQAELFGKMAQLAPTLEQAKQYIDEARRLAEGKGESGASWDLVELSLQLTWGNADAAGKLFNHIRSAHGREPGVMQALTELLIDAGLLRPDGSFVGAPQSEAQTGIVLPSSPVQESGPIWTPESASAGGEKKLWIPE